MFECWLVFEFVLVFEYLSGFVFEFELEFEYL